MVVVVLRVFDVGVHDAGGVVSALVGVFELIPAVHASHAAFVAFDGECVAVVEGEGGGSYFVVADGNVGDVSASENLCVFFCRAVLVEGDCVVGGVLVHGSYCSIAPRVCLHVWARGWLVVAVRGGCLFVCERVGFGWWCARCFVCVVVVRLSLACVGRCVAVGGFVVIGCVVGVGCVSFGGARG